MKRSTMWLSDTGPKVKLEMPVLTPMTSDDLQVVRKQLNSRGFKSTVIVDLTRKDLGIPVVRVIVPGLEVFAIDEDRVGPRMMGGRV